MWHIRPKESVGPVNLNFSLAEIEDVLGKDYDKFKRGNNPNEMLAFDGIGIHIELGAYGQVVALSVFPPVDVYLGSVKLLGKDMAIVEQELRDAGFTFAKVDGGLWDEELLIMLVEYDGRVDGVEVRRIPY